MTGVDAADAEVVFSLGSNFGDRKANVEAGIVWLSSLLSGFEVSYIYATPDCYGSQKEYLNAVAKGHTGLNPSELERLCKNYEAQCGRDAEARASNNVPIDIDLVVYSSEILRPRDYSREFFQMGYRQLTPSSP